MSTLRRWCRGPWLGALAAGLLAACGFQPLALWPLTLIGVGWLFWLAVKTPTARNAFTLGWVFGLGHFTLGNNWIATAFTYQANMPAWLGGIAVCLLSIYLALFPGLATLAGWLLARMGRNLGQRGLTPSSAAGFAAAWIVSEWLRSWVFTGFAWNPLGIAMLGGFGNPGLAKVTPWIGTYGLSGLTALLGGLFAWLIGGIVAARGRQRRNLTILAVAFAAAVALPMALPDRTPPEQGGIRYTLVQPDIRQETLNEPANFEPNFIKIAMLSLPRRAGSQRLVLWPESGVADYLREGYPEIYYQQFTYAADPLVARQRIGRIIGPYGLLLTGNVDLAMQDGEVAAARNVVTAIDGRGDILSGYAKAHLVPYGEYLPMRWLLEPLGASRLVAGVLDFWPGPGPRTFDLGAYGKAGIQICYEIVFSGEVVDPFNRPDYIFNPSNDGWFGAWGPPQHLAQARLRAIEEGIPVLRATTTGISAVIDANGVVRAHVPRHQAGRLDGFIPPAHAPTLFSRIGNALPLMLATLLLVLVLSPVALHRRRV